MNIANAITKLTDRFRRTQSAKCAKERLQIIISHERIQRDQPDYLAAMQRDLLDVIAKYVAIDKNDVRVELERQEGCSILELNVILPQALDKALEL
ncbi:MAG: cell division topological specificity factor MinE [Gammaproteobacteria bacterium]|nr:cell division topological specificity factor MinE [Gammaproteobacteria bacterium]